MALACLALDWSCPGRWCSAGDLAAAFVRRALGLHPGVAAGALGSHVVITTIMFNFLAASLMVFLLVNVFG